MEQALLVSMPPDRKPAAQLFLSALSFDELQFLLDCRRPTGRLHADPHMHLLVTEFAGLLHGG